MRKLLLLLSVIILTMCFVGCGSQPATNNTAKATVADNKNEGENDENVAVATIADDEDTDFDEKEVISNLKVTPYNYNTSFGSHHLILVVENKSTINCQLECSVDFYNKKNKLVGTKTDTIETFAGGTTECFEFICDEKFKKYEYSFTANELDYYDVVTPDLKCSVSTAKNKAIVNATNTGKNIAKSVKANVLFFKNKKLVYCSFGYLGDKKLEIKPGKSEKCEISCYEKFDSVNVYLDGSCVKE